MILISKGPTIPYMETPIPFITDVSGKWEINKEAMDILEKIYMKISVVAIVGKYSYRTKTYPLMYHFESRL